MLLIGLCGCVLYKGALYPFIIITRRLRNQCIFSLMRIVGVCAVRSVTADGGI